MALQSSTLRVELPGLRALSRNPRRGRMVVKDRSLRAVWVPYNQQNGDKGLPEQQPPTPTPSRQPAQPEVTDEQQAAGNAESPKSVTRLSVSPPLHRWLQPSK